MGATIFWASWNCHFVIRSWNFILLIEMAPLIGPYIYAHILRPFNSPCCWRAKCRGFWFFGSVCPVFSLSKVQCLDDFLDRGLEVLRWRLSKQLSIIWQSSHVRRVQNIMSAPESFQMKFVKMEQVSHVPILIPCVPYVPSGFQVSCFEEVEDLNRFGFGEGINIHQLPHHQLLSYLCSSVFLVLAPISCVLQWFPASNNLTWLYWYECLMFGVFLLKTKYLNLVIPI